MKLLLEYNVPMLILYTNIEEDPMVEIIKMVAKPYKEYFILMIVDMTKVENINKYSEFLMKFMGIHQMPALRIVNLKDRLNRYKFIGNLEANVIDYFI